MCCRKALCAMNYVSQTMTIGVSEPSLDQYLKYGHCSFRDQSRRNLISKYISAKLLQILNIIVLFIYVMKCNTCYTLFPLQQSIKAALFVHIKISINPLSGKIRGFLCLTCLFCQLLYSFVLFYVLIIHVITLKYRIPFQTKKALVISRMKVFILLTLAVLLMGLYSFCCKC